MQQRPHPHDDPNCPVCRSIWGGGRIRLDEAGAEELLNALRFQRLQLLVERKAVKGDTESVSFYNRRIADVLRVLEEVEHLCQERGWAS